MCRLVAITSNDYVNPMEVVYALNTMKEGHDGSGMGLLLKYLGGHFSDLKEYPILSGIYAGDGMELLDEYMKKKGFKLVYEWKPKIRETPNIKARGTYFARFYDYPDEYKYRSIKEKERLLTETRVKLRLMGEEKENLFVFSFYPDVVMLKEVGDPVEVAEFFSLDEGKLKSKIIMAQGRQNTNYSINLYSCHPFFIQGYSTMTNGENTAFVPIKEFLISRNIPGYMGYNSDSEVFTHILHYINHVLGYPLTYYKDVITPLKNEEIARRPDAEALQLIKYSLRRLCIDGPNCVIGVLPDGHMFMVQDSKKLRPGVVGGVRGKYVLASEVCALDRIIPERDRDKDVYPMKYDMVIVTPNAAELKVWNQLRGEFIESKEERIA
mgnify:CR=1 FL=1